MAFSSFTSDIEEVFPISEGLSLFRQVVNPNNRNESFALYDQRWDSEWKRWHATTEWREKFPERKVKWKNLKSGGWEHFTPCVRIRDGLPFACCNRCQHILEHPTTHSHGTKTLLRHPFSD
jgi:hypothetical protein